MYVDTNLQLASAVRLDTGQPHIINAGTYYLYISSVVDLGTGSKGLPFDHAFLKMVSTVAFEEVTPPCVITTRLVSGATDTLIADLIAGTFSQHYMQQNGVLSWTEGASPICVPIEANPGRYQRYLGIVMNFSGDGLSAGVLDAYITTTPYESRPLTDSLPS